MPPLLLVGLGSGVLLLVVLAFAESLDLLAFAAVLSYLAIYLFSFVLLRPHPERSVEPAPTSTRQRSADNHDQPS
ncbi:MULTISPECIES: hypothetical protein [unclassified Frankia]|uniref:hypothetical protein n=1 Tax=unclassified Frankia TaxID=2632575 RepID=UPI0020246B6A